MTKQEAIKVLKKELQMIDNPNTTITVREWKEHDNHRRDAFNMALEALSEDNSAKELEELAMTLLATTLWLTVVKK